MVNGVFVTTEHTIDAKDRYTAATDVQILPAADVVAPLVASYQDRVFGGFNIRVTNSSWEMSSYTYGIRFDRYFYPSISPPWNELSGSINVIHVGYSNVNGVIRNALNMPIQGAIVELTRSSTYGMYNPAWYDANYPALYYQTGSDGQFHFDNVKFVESYGNNLALKVTASGYNTGTDITEAYDGYNWTRNFNLVLPSGPVASTNGDL